MISIHQIPSKVYCFSALMSFKTKSLLFNCNYPVSITYLCHVCLPHRRDHCKKVCVYQLLHQYHILKCFTYIFTNYISIGPSFISALLKMGVSLITLI